VYIDDEYGHAHMLSFLAVADLFRGREAEAVRVLLPQVEHENDTLRLSRVGWAFAWTYIYTLNSPVDKTASEELTDLVRGLALHYGVSRRRRAKLPPAAAYGQLSEVLSYTHHHSEREAARICYARLPHRPVIRDSVNEE